MPEQLGGAQPLHQPPIGHGVSYNTPPAPGPIPLNGCQVPMQGYNQTCGQVSGTTSGVNQTFSLSPSPQSYIGITLVQDVWPEARPRMGYSGLDGVTPSGLQFGSTSGSLYLQALSPSPQSSIVQQHQPQPLLPSASRSPAYCFHSMQYGAVFNIHSV